MLGDRGRGWSWTRVLLGLPASQLHLCGDPAAAGLLEQLAAECGDTLDIKRYRSGRGVHGWMGRFFPAELLIAVRRVSQLWCQHPLHCLLTCLAVAGS